MEKMKPSAQKKDQHHIFNTLQLKRSWLSKKAFEFEFTRPKGFSFTPGQRIRFIHQSYERDYSLVSTPDDSTLRICVRKVEKGVFSSVLASTAKGTRFKFSGPHGYFTFRATPRSPVFVATGTGIAPFVSMAKTGVNDFTLLHGVSRPEELYYAELFRSTAKQYLPCISDAPGQADIPQDSFKGRVTDYLKKHLHHDSYEFYLCGRSEMIRDVTMQIDDHFSGSYVHTEIFF